MELVTDTGRLKGTELGWTGHDNNLILLAIKLSIFVCIIKMTLILVIRIMHKCIHVDIF